MNGLFLMEAHINITMVIKEKQCLQIFSQKRESTFLQQSG